MRIAIALIIVASLLFVSNMAISQGAFRLKNNSFYSQVGVDFGVSPNFTKSYLFGEVGAHYDVVYAPRDPVRFEFGIGIVDIAPLIHRRGSQPVPANKEIPFTTERGYPNLHAAITIIPDNGKRYRWYGSLGVAYQHLVKSPNFNGAKSGDDGYLIVNGHYAKSFGSAHIEIGGYDSYISRNNFVHYMGVRYTATPTIFYGDYSGVLNGTPTAGNFTATSGYVSVVLTHIVGTPNDGKSKSKKKKDKKSKDKKGVVPQRKLPRVWD